MFKDNLKLIGELNLLLIGKDGNVKFEKTYPNLVLASGKEYIAQRMTSNSTPIMSSIAVGSGTTLPNVSDTSLEEEIRRKPLTSVNVTSNTITYVCTFEANEGTGGLTEAGIFNSTTANSGTILCRTTFPVVNKEENDVFTITWNVTPI